MQTVIKHNTKLPDPVMASASPDEASINEFLAKVRSRLSQGVSRIQVDCAPLTRVTSSLIGALWQAREMCDQKGTAVELLNVSDGLRRVFDAMDLVDLFLPEPATPFHFDLQFAPTVEGIDHAMSNVVGFMAKSGVPEPVAFELQTIFYEVTTNIRRHGQLAVDDSIRFNAQIKEQTVRFTFADGGTCFNPLLHDMDVNLREASRQRRRNGFGLAMIKRLSDSLEYTRTPDAQNQFSIEKAW